MLVKIKEGCSTWRVCGSLRVQNQLSLNHGQPSVQRADAQELEPRPAFLRLFAFAEAAGAVSPFDQVVFSLLIAKLPHSLQKADMEGRVELCWARRRRKGPN